MFRKNIKWKITGGKIESVLGANTSLEGQLKVDGNLRIDGDLVGTLQVLGNLIIGERANVKADISAHSIQVWGMVEGEIVAKERLEILSSGRVFADVDVNALLIDDDAVFRGQCTIRDAAGQAQPPVVVDEASTTEGVKVDVAGDEVEDVA